MANPRRKKPSKRLVQRVYGEVRGSDTGVNARVNGDGVAEVFAALAKMVSPPEKVDSIQWLEAHRRLSVEASAEPGPFRFDRISYAIEPQRAILDPSVGEVVLCWASQNGKTEIATLNPLLYWSVLAPAPCLIVTPDWKSATSLSCDRIDPMLRDSRVPGETLEQPAVGQTRTIRCFASGSATA
jgi:phage terminase large subunit GpA-like protein